MSKDCLMSFAELAIKLFESYATVSLGDVIQRFLNGRDFPFERFFIRIQITPFLERLLRREPRAAVSELVFNEAME
jgi:hypothetical protein